MRKNLLALLVISMITGTLIAQNLQLKGTITEAGQHTPVEYANVILQTADSTFVAGTVSDASGSFTLNKIPSGNYVLAVNCMGYQDRLITLDGFSRSLDLGEIELLDASIELEGVVVSGSGMNVHSDRKIVFPSERQLSASSNGINLLQQLMLPKLEVNQLFNTVSLPGGGEVQFRINGIQVEETDIVALLPSEIIRVEYHDNPGLRYGNAEVVIDFIVKRPETGGNINVDGSQGINVIGWGNYQASAKINHKKSEFGFRYNVGHRNFHEMWRDNTETFTFADGSILKRVEEGEPADRRSIWQNATLNYSYNEPDKYLFNATVRLNHSDYNTVYLGRLYNVADPSQAVQMVDKNPGKSLRPSVDLYYQHELKNKQTVVVNVVGTYGYTEDNRIYLESQGEEMLTDIDNLVTGDRYSVIGEGIYEKRLGSNRVSAGVKHTHSFTDNEYRNGSVYNTYMKQTDTRAYAEFKGKVEKFDYTVGATVLRYWYKQRGEGDAYHYYTFSPRAVLNYKFSGSSSLRLNLQMSSASPSLSNLSAVDQQVDSIQLQRGNPGLKPYLTYRSELNYDFQKKIYYFNLYGSYRISPKAIMDEKYLEDEKVVQTWDNQKSMQQINGRATFRVGPIKDILQLSVTGGVNHYISNGNNYFHTYTNWYYRGSLSATWKKFVLGYEIQSNYNTFWGENLYGGENFQVLALRYNHKRFSLGVGAFNPFSDDYKVKSENWSQYASTRRANYVNESSRMFMVQFSYNLEFGRKFKSVNKKLNNSDSESGVMSTGK